MPSGSTILSTAPEGGEAKRGKNDEVRNEEARAADRRKLYIHISGSIPSLLIL
jgi:hypothetical protein